MIKDHLSSHLIFACPFEERQIESIICFHKMVSIWGMLLFSRNLPESTNSNSAAMSVPLCTFDSLSFCLHSDLLVSMDNLLLSISIDMSLIHWSSVHQLMLIHWFTPYQLMFIRWCIPHRLMFIRWCIPHQLIFIRWCIPHQLMFLTVLVHSFVLTK